MRRSEYSHAVQNGLVRAPLPDIPPVERRPKRRKAVLLPAVVASSGGTQKFDCTISDLTSQGARVSIPANTECPARVYLISIPERVVYAAQVVWNDKTEIGLAFSKATPLTEINDPSLAFLKRLWMERAIR